MSWLCVCPRLYVCVGSRGVHEAGVSVTAGSAHASPHGPPEFPRVCGSHAVWVEGGQRPREAGWGWVGVGWCGGGGVRGSAGPAPGRGEPPRAGGGAARQPHFGEVGGAEAGPGRARSPGKEGGGRREGRGRPPWDRGPGAAAAAVARCRRRHRCRPCGRCPCCYC